MEAGQRGWDQRARMFGKVRGSLQRGMGRDSGREANCGQEKELILCSKNNDIKGLNETAPSQSAEGVTLWVQTSFRFLEVEPTERGGWKAGCHLSH